MRFVNPAAVVTNEVWRLTGNEANWQQQLPLRRKRQFHSTVVIEGDIYHAGGCINEPCRDERLRFDKSAFIWGVNAV